MIAQERSSGNGQWMPQHHLAAAAQAERWARQGIPIVSFMDTVGADSGAEANRGNQAHAISRLITVMCDADVPTLGIILGLGYSGGAIPLAASNLILSVRDGVFNTINPKGLASIARKYNLSWQECAKQVGVSAQELWEQGNIDGIVDYVPGEGSDRLHNLRQAIVTSIPSIEQSVAKFVTENPYIADHYLHHVSGVLHPASAARPASAPPDRPVTEFTNIFGVAFRYLRYLSVRRRVRGTSRSLYGRLAEVEIPRGELRARAGREQQRAFLSWVQDPEKLVYEESLSRTFSNYRAKQSGQDAERGRLAQLFLGEPRQNYEDARARLLLTVSGYLYNRWKTQAAANFRLLVKHLENPLATRMLLRVSDLHQARDFANHLREDAGPASVWLREQLSVAGRKLVSKRGLTDRSDASVSAGLATELNLIMLQHDLEAALGHGSFGTPGSPDSIRAGYLVLKHHYPDYLAERPSADHVVDDDSTTVMDLLLSDDLRADFRQEFLNILLFDALYDQIIQSLDSIAEEAQRQHALSEESLRALLDRCLRVVAAQLPLASLELADEPADALVEKLHQRLFAWLARMQRDGNAEQFLKLVDEWKRTAFPHVSDVLLVVMTVLFLRVLPSLANTLQGEGRYNGRLNPRSIGRRKDFWNRLTTAYRDLQIQKLLATEKNKRSNTVSAFVDEFFADFREIGEDRLSSDPVGFPGFRVSIENALDKDVPPCGVVTGTGTFRMGEDSFPCGAVISNVDFQAGAFDMASAEKVCHLLVQCVQQGWPVICFISSGGMQTKEGAGALFSMAVVNDRITRFVRDHHLPVIVFGFGDCTGGAQASFVTHPLVHTYYFSGTNMPFAGQIVTPSNLPCDSTLSNYLSRVDGAMQGLVRHPFQLRLDDDLRRIDAQIPLPGASVRDVVSGIMSGASAEIAPLAATGSSVADEAGETGQLLQPVKRTLIHARGCAASKLVRIAQAEGIEVVLVQSDPDMESVAADMLGVADRLICIGGNTPDESYLNGLSVVRVAELEQADSLHPGIGFLSESSQFAQLCRSHGINFIGPPLQSMEAMGNKSNAVSTARELGVPVVPGSYGILTNADAASRAADEIGYPVLIKAVHGGGGKGIQIVQSADEFHDLFHQVQAEARSAFGNGDVYLEKCITSLRHIEAQLLRDTHGNTLILGIRDCSVQRNKQKVIEESGSTALPPELIEQVCQYTALIGDKVGYTGAGTVEFIYDLQARQVYFMEMNTRLQVEHPVTEMTSGVDIVGWQFRIAAGRSIAEQTVADHGHAIEVRVTAERVVPGPAGTARFSPDPGVVSEWQLPVAEGIEVIPAVAAGKTVSPFYDSMLAQIIAYGDDRNAAIDRLLEYLQRGAYPGHLHQFAAAAPDTGR